MAFHVFLEEKVNVILIVNVVVFVVLYVKLLTCHQISVFQVDVAIVEVGCGGEYDTTNLIRLLLKFFVLCLMSYVLKCSIDMYSCVHIVVHICVDIQWSVVLPCLIKITCTFWVEV
jgi:TctA family transporter